MKGLWLPTLASLLAACEHQASPKPNGGNPGVYEAAGDTCPATCSTPAGTLQSLNTDAGTWAALVGVWRICSGPRSLFADAPADTIGVEFAPPHTDLPYDAAATLGNLYFLTWGASGPVRGGGFDYQQTYDVDRGTVYCHPYYNSGYSLYPAYSPCPRELKLQDYDHVVLLAPF
jgi:hypothetical protein